MINYHSLSRGISFFLFIVLFSAPSLRAQDLNAQLDNLLNENYKPNEPGAIALVAKGNEVLYRKAVGMADLENNISLTPNHVIEIGSITKQITAVAILMLLEEGKLSLEDPIEKFVEKYPTHGYKITIHHLLTHTSGIKSYTSMEKWTKLWRQDMTPMEMIDLFKNEPMDFAPGEKWSYNNSAYFILGYVIEKASGMPYPEYVEKKIFAPLGMKNSYYGSMSKIILNRARPYQKRDNEFRNAEYLSLTQPYAAGSIMSTVDDLLTWNTAVHAGKLVKKETLQKAETGYKLNNGKPTYYGYGWGIDEIKGSPVYEHSGGIFGYTTNGIYFPKENVYVIVLTNRDDQGPEDLSIKMAALAIGKPITKPVSKVKLDEAYAKSLTGVYDFDENVSRYIIYDNGSLYSQRPGSPRFEVFPQDKTHFSFDGDLTSLEFLPDKKTGKITGVIFKNRIRESRGVRTDKPIPAHTETRVAEDILKQYVGVYEIQPGFNLTISLEDGHLMSQASGQQKVEIFPESKTKFFLKVVDAQIEFIEGTDKKYSLVLYQGGQKVPGKRKD